MRHSGLDIIGDVPWGAHFCQFYQTPQDLLDVLVGYFRQGLHDNECCTWIISEPLGAEEARNALRRAVPDLDERIRRGQIEFLDCREWHAIDGQFDSDRVLAGWAQRERAALDRGYAGLRLGGNTFWLEKSDWTSFTDYEAAVDQMIGSHRMMALCTYSLDKCGAFELMDMLRNHQFTLIKQEGKWELIQSRHAREKIRHQDALLEGINRIFHEALACDTEEELGHTCLAVAEEVTGSRFGLIGEMDAAGRLAEIAISDPGWSACRMDTPTGHGRVPGSLRIHGLYGRVLLDGKGFFTNDPSGHPDSIGTPSGHPPLRSFLGVPLAHAGKTVGLLAVANREGGYRREDLRSLESLAVAIVQVFMHKRSEQALRHQREWLRVTLNSIGDAVIATDTTGRITFLNPVAMALTGWTREEALGQPVSRVLRTIDEGTRQPCANVVAQVLNEKRAVAMDNRTALLTRDGREVPIEDSAAPILDAAGDVTGVVLVFHDVAEKRRVQDALVRAKQTAEAASRAKDQFIAALSHELRTPLMPSLAAAGAMIKDPRLPEDVRADAAMIQRNIGLEVTLINDLLDVTRIANNKLVLNKAPVDLAHILREAAGICCGDLDARSQTLTIDTPGAPYPVDADAARLHQVFWNLIKNATKFTPDRGRIEIQAAAGGGSVRVSIHDDGMGIDAAIMPKLFSAFEQGNRSHAFGGLGLGLAIAKGVVEAHAGQISVQSDGRGKGATFTVDLPLLRTDEALLFMTPAAPGRETDDEQLAARRSLRILLVEDHADTARMMARLLMAEGHEVVTADCVRAGLAAADHGPFDMLVSDLGLPDGTGYDLIRELIAAGKAIKGIAVSGYGTVADIQKSLDAGFVEHITKPVAFDALHQAIIRIMRGAKKGLGSESAPPPR